LFRRHDFGKLALEKDERLFHGHACTLEEETILQATPMLQFAISLETSVQLRHAERHAGGRQGINVRCRHFSFDTRLFGVILVSCVVRVHCLQQWCNTSLLFDVVKGSRGHDEATREGGTEFGRQNGNHLGERNVGQPFGYKTASIGYQIEGLREWNGVVGSAGEFTWSNARHAHERLTKFVLFSNWYLVNIDLLQDSL
jgi:hypothetical protein